jgi:cobalt-precorrin 5A hydrolase/precorrin-3B C17-methyltransferase
MIVPPTLVIVVLDQGGLALARKLAKRLPGAEVHGLSSRVTADVGFTAATAHLRKLFAAGHSIVGVMAAGILIRALAPMLADKRAEPPVIALGGDGKSVVPLLGGHHGANRLATRIAALLKTRAAVTTAGDAALGLALDEPPTGYSLANPKTAKAVAAALLAGEPARLLVEAGDAAWLKKAKLKTSATARVTLRVTDQATKPGKLELVYHPRTLALGVGCERGTAPKELIGLARRALKVQGLAPQSVACVVSLDLKADEAAVHALAADLGVPARFFTAKRLERETPRLENPSQIVFKAVGCHGVAEGAALAAAGARGSLILPKTASRRATVAIARSPRIVDGDAVGAPQGRLDIVGLGPGDAAYLTPDARMALLQATDAVGYDLYLDLAGDLIGGATRHALPLGAEEARVKLALDLAAKGKRVALISSGDPGIYAMAAPLFEMLERMDKPAWNRVAIAVRPGISAMQMAAARAGAPLGHDFCAISLSDLLTPRAAIERRLRAAAAGDFVVALYNPVSRRRRELIVTARDILLAARGPETPVLLAHDLGRPTERLQTIALKNLRAESAGMTTLVMIGASTSKAIKRGARDWLYTPRGYAVKHQKEKP